MSSTKLLASLLLVLAASCGGRKQAASPEAEAAATSVQTVAASQREVTTVRAIPATVTARTTVAVSSRLPGNLREVRVQVGDRVNAGQVVAVVDAREADTAVQQAEAALNQVRAGLPEAQAGIAAARAQLDLAQVSFRRMQELKDKKSITDQEFDEAQSRFRLAQSQQQMAQAKVMQLQEQVHQAEQGVARARLQQGYATVTAPLAGIVLERRGEPGAFTGPGQPILMLEKAGDYRLEAAAEESLLKEVRPGRKVEVSLDALGETLTLPITDLLPALDSQSRTFTVRINLPARPLLRSGLSATLRLPAQPRTGVVVPAAAVRRNGQLQQVFTVSEGRARAQLVTTGESAGGYVEVLSGLAPGEQVIHPLPPALADGARVAGK
jgi:membrane fusion protein, multidrug efflux system